MRLQITHRTKHEYGGPVSFSDHKVFLRPLDSHRRTIHSFTVDSSPAATQRWLRDVHGNVVLVCNFGLLQAEALEFTAQIDVSIKEENPFDFILEPYATGYPFNYANSDLVALKPCLGKEARKGELRVLDWFYSAVTEPIRHPDVIQFLSDLNGAVYRDIAYVRRDEEGIQSSDTTLDQRTGSCRDMAQLFIAVTRQLGFASRFVSGYLFDPPVEPGSEDAFFNRAVGSMHAWVEVYLPGAGWKGFDPTNGILANSYFVPSAVSHDPMTISPIQGTYYSEQSVSAELEVDLSIEEKADEA